MPQPTPRQGRDTSIRSYRARRDFAATPEPAPGARARAGHEPIFVVQKHDARRLHWDFRLEHGGVLWSWAVPKGPSLDTADKRLAVRTEDHPLDYADFAGTIPEGHYGAGTVETWDRGTWEPQAEGDPAAALSKGELKFVLHGTRLNGGFVLVRLKPRPKDRTENWLLIKEHDALETPGADAPTLERDVPPPAAKPTPSAKGKKTPSAKRAASPIPGAVRGELPKELTPQLATPVDEPPEGGEWLSEVKFDGYRLLAFKDGATVRLLTRNGHDWTARLPTIARSVARLGVETALLDGELVALREDGVSSFALLQQALSDGIDRNLFFYLFDLPHLDGWDLRGCKLLDRKQALGALSDWRGSLRYSDHFEGQTAAMRRQACGMGLEGIICKQPDAPYRAGSRQKLAEGEVPGSRGVHRARLHPARRLPHRTGRAACRLPRPRRRAAVRRRRRHRLHRQGTRGAAPPARRAREPTRPPAWSTPASRRIRQIAWVKPELVAEVQFVGWSGSGRIRHATYLGLREDKIAGRGGDGDGRSRGEADRICPAPSALRDRPGRAILPAKAKPATGSREAVGAPPRRQGKVIAAPKQRDAEDAGDVHLTHADRELWPGITKRDLAEYWLAVAEHALPEIAHRPLALVRCPEGIDGERFFQKHARPGFPKEIRAGQVGSAPYLVIDDVAGLLACAQVSAIELHAWGSREAGCRASRTGWCSTSIPATTSRSPRRSARRTRCASG